MNTATIGKFALALTVAGALIGIALAIVVAAPIARAGAVAIVVVCAIAAFALVRLDAFIERQRHEIAQTLAQSGTGSLALLSSELLVERTRTSSLIAIGPAIEEIVERRGRVESFLLAEEDAIGETRAASGEALRTVQSAHDSVGSLSRSVSDSSAAIEEMVSSIRLVSDNIGGLADTVNSVSSAIGELAVSIGQVAGNAQEANTLSLEADKKARDGGKAVERLVHSTREIAGDISSVVNKMQELGAASVRIGNIVEVIDNIADQTNLLALNAAIEAARAGEHGRGFAVVADEVRKLAENSASSTKEIGSLIKDIQAKTGEVVRSTMASGTKAESGLQMADLAGRAIDDILGAVTEASRLIEQITTAAKEQALGSSAIVNSVEQMNSLMHEAARSLDEQNTSNHQMIATITQMQTLTQHVNAAIAEQRSACERIDDATQRLTHASQTSRDASVGVEDVAKTLLERIGGIAGGLQAPPPGELEHATSGFVQLTLGR
ncbi:MAG: hypothetical protein NVSMB5_25120 [Candidatus Velthaea sp.]